MSSKLRLIIALAIIITGIVIIFGREYILGDYQEDDFFGSPTQSIRVIQPSQ